MAGKVVVEMLYPCVRVPWRPGRQGCGIRERSLFPRRDWQKESQMADLLRRWGFNATEMAILIAGTHGVALATIHQEINPKKPEHFQGELPMARVDSIRDYMYAMLDGGIDMSWHIIRDFTAQCLSALFKHRKQDCKDYTHLFKINTDEGEVYRIPFDAAFYPKMVKNAKTNDRRDIFVEERFSYLEPILRKYLDLDDLNLHKEFAKIFSKMLNVNVVDELWKEHLPYAPLDLENPRSALCADIPDYKFD